MLDRHMGKILFGVLTLAIGGLIYLGMQSDKHMARLMDQCMADGKKEYECYAMLHHEDKTTVVPVPVVIGR